MDYRIGTGADAHALAEQRPLILGGVTIPHPRGLAGHSDGDALAHAVIDAILGAAAAGDIGAHFPPGDPTLAGISSLILLKRAAALIAAAGWNIVNIDATMLAQRPPLAPHLPAMRANIAAALTPALPPDAGGSLPTHRISIKATTTDYLGFTGREEGIAAVAVALLCRPPGSDHPRPNAPGLAPMTPL